MQTILSGKQILQKTERLAHELLEDCFDEPNIFIGGIEGNGIVLAERLAEIMRSNSDVSPTVFTIKVNKDEPWADPIELSIDEKTLKNGYIILVDDVINSGKTMQFALIPLLQFPTHAIKTVALVDRKHRRFPIKANFVGLRLSTTLKERVEVNLSAKEAHAYLV